MADEENKDSEPQEAAMPPAVGGILENVDIEEEMSRDYIDYSMSVIVGRALPDVRDGLKPVHRRCLYSMYMLDNVWNKKHLKSARIVGDVIGKYHPHGDSAVYETIVRMAQDFSLRVPLVDGHGNFGSIDGDGAAAMRYTEVRMQKVTDEMLADLEKDTVDMVPNFDETLTEPSVLPAKLPNLLLNGSSGIARVRTSRRARPSAATTASTPCTSSGAVSCASEARPRSRNGRATASASSSRKFPTRSTRPR